MKRFLLICALVTVAACGKTPARDPKSISQTGEFFPPAEAQDGCENAAALKIVTALRSGGWSWDGYVMNGHGISIWYANDDYGLGLSVGGTAKPGSDLFKGSCAKLIVSEVAAEQQRGTAAALR